MTSSEKYLKPHTVFGDKSFEEYCFDIPEFYFKKDVSEDVVKNFEVVEKLLALSFYEYKFIDEAYSKALYTLEMAMRNRYCDFVNKSKKETFNNLIIELTKLNVFDTDLETLKHMKFMRNYYAHPQRHAFAGAFIWNKIEFICRLINEMYEDINLRLERQKLNNEFLNKQKKFNLEKSLVLEIEGKLSILYSFRLLFINNKCDNPSYIFAGTPLFDFEISEGRGTKVPYAFKAKLIDPKISRDGIEGFSFSSNKLIKIYPIKDYPELIPEFQKWNLGFDSIQDKFPFEANMNFFLPKILIPELLEFQKT